MQNGLNIYDNVANYKRCKKKQYDIHVCMPPKNTVVINKLEHFMGELFSLLMSLIG